mmetsp:Transcript_26167/g.62437  ORF Transcript_26167/g.62437 Transcript_26167/m.62437 type:complete len:365 (-) Transcript_26167:318-1412(-)
MAMMGEYQDELGGGMPEGEYQGHRVIPIDPAEVERVVNEFRSKLNTEQPVSTEFHKVSEERFMTSMGDAVAYHTETQPSQMYQGEMSGMESYMSAPNASVSAGMLGSVSGSAGGMHVHAASSTEFIQGPFIQCDVFPNKMAAVHDVWSGCNFCAQVQEALEEQGKEHPGKYFSRGVTAPRFNRYHDEFNANGTLMTGPSPPMSSDARAGIGIVLERSEDGVVYIKRIAADGPAAREGTLQVGDVLLQVDGVPARGMGQELTNLIVGPPATVVALLIERDGQLVQADVRRATPVASNVASSNFKTYTELPFYISEADKSSAVSEAAKRVAEMRSKFLTRPESDSKTTATEMAKASGFGELLGTAI